MEASHSISLQDVSSRREEPGNGPDIAAVRLHSSNNEAESSVPRADGGKDAWLFLAACFVVEALVWGE